MPKLTIELEFSGDEVPASVALLSLTDSATGLNVSAAAGLTLPAAFAPAGSGAFTLPFTDTGATSYNYSYRLTWSDASHTDQADTISGLAASSAAGQWAEYADLVAFFGSTNVQKWSQKDNAVTTPDYAAIQAALDWADSQVTLNFRASRFAMPLVPQDPMASATVKHWSVVLAGWRLYFSRGHQEQDKKQNRYDEQLDAVRAEMRQCRAGILDVNFATRYTQPTSPVPGPC
jgi:hypothetical protein